MKAGFRATKVDVHLAGYERDPGYMGRVPIRAAQPHPGGHRARRDPGHPRAEPPGARGPGHGVARLPPAGRGRGPGARHHPRAGAVPRRGRDRRDRGRDRRVHRPPPARRRRGALRARCRSAAGSSTGPHGRIPVPGPATAELLKGFPTLDTGIRRELVTPTGAAILTTLAAGAGAMPAMRVTAVGLRGGTMDLETPNVLRLFVGEASGAAPPAPRPRPSSRSRPRWTTCRPSSTSRCWSGCSRAAPSTPGSPRHHEAQPPRASS